MFLSWTLWGSPGMSTHTCACTSTLHRVRGVRVWPFSITPPCRQPHFVFGWSGLSDRRRSTHLCIINMFKVWPFQVRGTVERIKHDGVHPFKKKILIIFLKDKNIDAQLWRHSSRDVLARHVLNRWKPEPAQIPSYIFTGFKLGHALIKIHPDFTEVSR